MSPESAERAAARSAGAPGGRSLAGRRILVPRGGALGDRLAAGIRERGGEAVVAPLTVTAPPERPDALAAAADRWNRGSYDWLVVTSAAGAHAFAEAGAKPRSSPVAAVGPATADTLGERGFEVAVQPGRDFSARGLAEALIEALAGRERRRLLLPLSEIAGTDLQAALTAAGHSPERVTAYRTIPAPRDAELETAVAAGGFDAILAMSGSGAREIARRFAPIPAATAVVAIGGPTARALADFGLRAGAIAEEHTSGGLLAVLAALPLPPSDHSNRSEGHPA